MAKRKDGARECAALVEGMMEGEISFACDDAAPSLTSPAPSSMSEAGSGTVAGIPGRIFSAELELSEML